LLRRQYHRNIIEKLLNAVVGGAAERDTGENEIGKGASSAI
jgi:hypothetical protein